jgi:3-oxoadipate enol-lactonase
VSSVELHYVLEGAADGRVVVLSPSLGTELAMWDAQAALLGARFRVLRYDLRGHGASPVPAGPYTLAGLGGDLLALLDRLEIERASLCGISIGGMISIWIAARAPQRVRRLAVCCTSALIDPEGSYRERAQVVREQGLEAIVDAVMARWVSEPFAEREPAVVEGLRAGLLGTPREGYAGCCEALADMDLRGELGSVSSRTLVIAGADDPATPPEHGRRIASGIRGASFEMVPDAMHLANVEQPDAVGGLILRFLTAGEEERSE